MRTTDAETLLFFEGHRDALELYFAFEDLLHSTFPNVNRRVKRTQISFCNRHVFACVSFARVTRKANMPPGCIVVTLGLPSPLKTDRAAVITEPYPGRWTHHFVVSMPEELDEDMLGWIRQAYAFADAK